MPETRIGFFPDVGVGFHLAKLPDSIGDYLALTGERLTANDAYHLGLVKAVIPSERLGGLENALITTAFNSTDFNAVTRIIMKFHQQPELVHLEHFAHIKKYFAAHSVKEIVSALEQDADPWSKATLQTLAAQSPLSLKVTYEHLRHCVHLDFPQVMAENLRIARNFLHNHDFMEGVRAAMIDKDQRPQWRPATLSAVSETIVQSYFLF